MYCRSLHVLFSITLGNGTSFSPPTSEYTGTETSLIALYKLAGDATDSAILGVAHASYTYDAAGRPISRDALDGITHWGYDTRDRLVSERGLSGTTTWLYDAASRRTGQITSTASTSYSFDAADQLLASTTAGQVTSFLYDRNGSTTSLQLPTGAVTTYAWDAANRRQRAASEWRQVYGTLPLR